MNSLISFVTTLAADAPAKGGGGGGGAEGLFGLPTVFLIIAVLFLYFFMIKPQRKDQARREAMMAGLKKNDRVLTAGGIYGVVLNVHREANEVTIRVDEATNAKLRVTLSSITQVLGDEPTDETKSK